MVIVVAGGEVTLEAPDELGRFHIEVSGGMTLDDVNGTLVANGAGRLADDGEHGMIDIDWLRRQAAGRVGADWDHAFEGMLGYARSKGWIADAGNGILGHLERSEG